MIIAARLRAKKTRAGARVFFFGKSELANSVFQLFARAEHWNFASWDLDLFASLWVAANASFASGNSECSEANKLNAVLLLDVF
jgi:hypothetical protein